MVQSDGYSRAFNQLCHMMSLSKDGRVEEAIDNLVLTILYMEPKLKFDKQIRNAISEQFGTTLTVTQVSESIERIGIAGKLTEMNPVVLSTEERQAIEARIGDSEALEKNVKSDWFDLVQSEFELEGHILETLWSSLKDYMAQVFKQHGVQTIRFFDPAFQGNDEMNVSLDTFLKSAYEKFDEIHSNIKRATFDELVELFFNMRSPRKSQYISQSLDSTFTFFALNAAEELSEFLQSSIPELTILIDTNFIYELIGLDEKVRDDLSGELISIIKDSNLPIKLYFHPETRGEYLRTLDAASRELRYFPDKNELRPKWTSNQSQNQLMLGNLSAIARKYHQSNSKQTISLDVFLEKYSQFELLLSVNGINEYHNLPDIDHRDIQSLSRDYEVYLPAEIHKSKSVIKHDMILMKTVEKIRNPNARGIGVGAFFLTNDNQLYSFDWYFIRNHGVTGVTIQPGQFLQLLRPLIKTTSDFDKRFVETIAKTSFRSAATKYTGETEQTLLSYLSQYADVPQEIAMKMLSNAYFIENLKQYDKGSLEFKNVIEDEIAKHQTEALKAEIERSQDLEQNVSVLQEQLDQFRRQREHDKLETEKAREHDKLETEKAIEEVRRKYEERISEGQKYSEEKELQKEREKQKEKEMIENQLEQERAKFRWLLGFFIVFVGIMFIWVFPAYFVDWQWLETHPHRRGLQIATSLIIVGLVWTFADKNHRREALFGIVLAAVLTIAQIIGAS
ncbi:MAG: hypothetical protein K8L97_30135 [Anaerolineae bacterium]|nr:hypothetical protein [Anaerolineae bacterium]